MVNKTSSKTQNIIAIIGLIILALFILIFTNNIKMHKMSKLCIEFNGNNLTEIDGRKLDINTNSTYILKNGEDYNIIEIKDGKIACIESNCPDQICVKKGFIDDSFDNNMIICAPHRLAISFK